MELLRRQHDEARARLPEPAYDYFAGGAGDELTLAENQEAWRRVWLRPRHGLGLGAGRPAVELLGARMAAPIVLAPAAAQGLLHPEGELAVARAAADAGLVMCLSTRATTDLADVAAATAAPKWFQLYMEPDRSRVQRILQRAAEHGYAQVVMTIDLPVAGRREREWRHGPVAFPPGVALTDHLGAGTGRAYKPPVGGWYAPTWEDVGWVRQAGGLPVVLKGVLTAEDALIAAQAGAAAVAVSNHGGASSTASCRRRSHCATSPPRSRAASRCWSTAAFAPEPMSSARWPWAPTRCSSGGPTSGRSPRG